MGLLAYHPEEVGRLHLAMRRALDDLRTLSCNDPAAADAMRLVRGTATQLETAWLPLALRLLTTDPLSAGQRRDAGIGALDQSLIAAMSTSYGWSVQTDPLADNATIVTVEEARALGTTLNQIDPTALAEDPEQLAWLAQQLAVIGADPVLSREFLTTFENWDTLPFALGTQRAALLHDGGDGGASVAALDGVFNGLMAAWRNTLDPRILAAGTQATVGSLLPDLHAPDPYVQALMLRGLDLDPMTLATVSHELLTVWIERKNDGATWSIDLGPRLGPNAADILLAEVANDPIACVRFLTLAQDDLDVLFWTLDDPEIGHDIVLAATDPANVTARQAEPLVLAVLEYFRTDPYQTARSTDGHPGEYGQLLGALVAPWLLFFTPSNTVWTATPVAKQHALQIVFDNDDAIDRLIADSSRIISGFGITTAPNLAQQMGELLNMLHEGVLNARVADEADAHQHAGWDLMWTVLGAATSFLDVAAPYGIAIGFGVDQLGTFLGQALLDHADPDGLRRALDRDNDASLTIVAATWLSAWCLQQRAEGKWPADAAPPPVVELDTDGDGDIDTDDSCVSATWWVDFDTWLAGLPGGSHGLLALRAKDVVTTVIGSGQAAGNCQQVQ